MDSCGVLPRYRESMSRAFPQAMERREASRPLSSSRKLTCPSAQSWQRLQPAPAAGLELRKAQTTAFQRNGFGRCWSEAAQPRGTEGCQDLSWQQLELLQQHGVQGPAPGTSTLQPSLRMQTEAGAC